MSVSWRVLVGIALVLITAITLGARSRPAVASRPADTGGFSAASRAVEAQVGSGVTITEVAAGDAHTCALTSAGGIKCWGANFNGQLGNGTNQDSISPVDVVGLSSGVTSIAAGADHTCAVLADGRVECWGRNLFGSLGNGNTTDSSTPVEVSGLGASMLAVTAGVFHTCGLTTGGGVKCWGGESYALGNGTADGSLVPVDVTGLTSGVLSISAGGWHTCAVTSAGGAKCWGANYNGRLGDGTTNNATVPVDVAGLASGVVAVAGGYYHTCAVLNSGGVKCWGANDAGQLGDGTTTPSITPVDVQALTGSVGPHISAGATSTCAAKTSGNVTCWGGYGNYGGVGNGSTPWDVEGLADVVALGNGSNHVCAVTSAGGVECWGNNGNGQSGNGFMAYFSTWPIPVSFVNDPNLIPTVDSLTPMSGPPGTTVSITGTGLSQALSVTIYGGFGEARFTPVNDSAIAVTIPDLHLTSGAALQLRVTTVYGTSTTGAVFTYVPNAAPSPTVSSIQPSPLPMNYAGIIDVYGNNFTATTVLRANGQPQDTTVVDAGHLQANIVPAMVLAPSISIDVYDPSTGLSSGSYVAAVVPPVTVMAVPPTASPGSLVTFTATVAAPSVGMVVNVVLDNAAFTSIESVSVGSGTCVPAAPPIVPPQVSCVPLPVVPGPPMTITVVGRLNGAPPPSAFATVSLVVNGTGTFSTAIAVPVVPPVMLTAVPVPAQTGGMVTLTAAVAPQPQAAILTLSLDSGFTSIQSISAPLGNCSFASLTVTCPAIPAALASVITVQATTSPTPGTATIAASLLAGATSFSSAFGFPVVPPPVLELRHADEWGNALPQQTRENRVVGSRERACLFTANGSPVIAPINPQDVVLTSGGGYVTRGDVTPGFGDPQYYISLAGSTCFSWVSFDAGEQHVQVTVGGQSISWDTNGDGNGQGPSPADPSLVVGWNRLEGVSLGAGIMVNPEIPPTMTNAVGTAQAPAQLTIHVPPGPQGYPPVAAWIEYQGSHIRTDGSLFTIPPFSSNLNGVLFAAHASDPCVVTQAPFVLGDYGVGPDFFGASCVPGSTVDVTITGTEPFPVGVDGVNTASAVLHLVFDPPVPPPSATLTFQVSSSEGSQISSATVQITSEQTIDNRTLTADSIGVASFASLPVGNWRYSVSAPGFSPVGGVVSLSAGGTTLPVTLDPSISGLDVSFTVTKTTIQDTYVTDIDLEYVPSASTPNLQLNPGILAFQFACQGDTLPGSIKVKNSGSVVMSDVQIDTGSSNQSTIQFKQTSPPLMLGPGEEGTLFFTISGVPSGVFPPADLVIQGSYRLADADHTFRRGAPVLVSGSCLGDPPAPVVTVSDSGSTIRISGPSVPGWVFTTWTRSTSNGSAGSESGGVHLRLSQEISIEREAFAATLKLANPSSLLATNIRVTISALAPSGEVVTSEFGVTEPELTGGLTGIGGDGTLPSGSTGQVGWTLIPGGELGGDDPAGLPYVLQARLSYRIGNVDFDVVTAPETITVTPQPKLELHYTVNKHVIGGAFTVQLEILNVGKGIARNVRVGSLAPQILSNSSGLPLSFAIVGSQLGSDPKTTSQILSFGDIGPGGSSSGRFFGSASEDGYFTDQISSRITHTNFKGIELDPLITDVTVLLKDPSQIVGSVRQPDGIPVVGATVTVRWWADGVAAVQASGITSESGDFSVGVDLQGGSGTYVFEVDAARPDYWIPARRLFEFRESDITPASQAVEFIAFDHGLASRCADPHSSLPQECIHMSGIGSRRASNLIFVTHGWCNELLGCTEGQGGPLVDLAEAVSTAVSPKGWASDWEAVYYDWNPYAGTTSSLSQCVEDVRLTASKLGAPIGSDLQSLQYRYIHFLGHSAGSWLIDFAGTTFGGSNQQTYLDAFVGADFLAPLAWPPCGIQGLPIVSPGIHALGDHATWADHYFDDNSSAPYTNSPLQSAVNLDVTEQRIGDSHGSPIRWYTLTAQAPTRSNARGFGFVRSREWTGADPGPSEASPLCGGRCLPGQIVPLPPEGSQDLGSFCVVSSPLDIPCLLGRELKPSATVNAYVEVGLLGAKLTFRLAWPGSDVRLSLTSPSGKLFDRSTVDQSLSHLLTPTTESYTITDPEPGRWLVTVYGLDVAADGENAVLQVLVDNTPPILTPLAKLADGRPYSPGTWTNETVTLAFNCSDAGSGVANCPAGLTFSTDGSYTPTVTATDGAGNVASLTFGPVRVDKTPPVAAPSQSPVANGTGWNNSNVAVNWNWTDTGGAGIDPTTCTTTSTSAGEGTLLLSASCIDLAGNSATATYTARVDKTAPIISLSSPVDLSINPVGLTLTYSASDDISGVLSVVATLTDGTTSADSTVTSGKVITSSGVYSLTVTATDNAGNITTATRMFVVYDASAGFVTGGGWITSPPGACKLTSACVGSTGKATFGFVAKYLKGASVPTGNTQFQFHDGGLDFKSTAYQWLVIAGTKAQYKGSGTINGIGDYTFLLTAIDGDLQGGGKPDKFRIKIWDTTTGTIVYDNQMGADDGADPTTTLGGGSIIIQKS